MSSLRFLFLALLIFALLGPLVPVPAMYLLASRMTPKGAGMVAGFFSSTLGAIALSYLFGAPIAFGYGLAFVTLLLLEVCYVPFLRFSSRWVSAAYGALVGAAIAAPVVFLREATSTDHLAFTALLFALPSVLCGGVIGLFLLLKLTANISSHRTAYGVHLSPTLPVKIPPPVSLHL